MISGEQAKSLLTITILHCLLSSGGHINPIVSFGIFLSGGISFDLMVAYILSQLLGGISAAGMAKVPTQRQTKTDTDTATDAHTVLFTYSLHHIFCLQGLVNETALSSTWATVHFNTKHQNELLAVITEALLGACLLLVVYKTVLDVDGKNPHWHLYHSGNFCSVS